MFAFIMAFTLVVFAVLLSVFIADDVEEILKIPATDFPSVTPQTSFDTRPTFDIVQERGYLLCGLQNRTEDSFHHLHTTLMACLTLETKHSSDVLRNICVTTNVQVLSYVLKIDYQVSDSLSHS